MTPCHDLIMSHGIAISDLIQCYIPSPLLQQISFILAPIMAGGGAECFAMTQNAMQGAAQLH